MDDDLEGLKEEYIRLSKKQQEHLRLASTLSEVSVARKMLIKAMSSNTERLDYLAESLRSSDIDPADLHEMNKR